MKKEYVAPALEELGSLREVTQGSQFAWALDAEFSRGDSLLGHDPSFS